MILTQCACCAAELGLSSGKKCGRCSTRYCGPECQVQHWKDGGHDKLCRKIRKGGGAEQYNANTKYTEAVAVAAEACADDTKGQTCYICTQAVHWKTKEGLIRGCACRGTAGFAHVSCLVEQAKILFAEGEENNVDDKVKNERWARWSTCFLCEQRYHGVVRCALGWACWKTYLGRSERDWARRMAVSVLGAGLHAADLWEDELTVREAELSTERRIGADLQSLLIVQTNLARTYERVGRKEEALSLERYVYSGRLKLLGEGHPQTLSSANNYAVSLVGLQRFEEAKALLRKTLPVARRILRESMDLLLKMRMIYGMALYMDAGATLDDLREAVKMLEENERIARRVLGGAHPLTTDIERALQNARAALRARETLAEAMAATTLGDA